MSIRTLTKSLIGVAVAAATFFVASPAAVSADSHSSDPGLVRIDTGWLRGSVAADHVKYSAIPYAAPPVGQRRWRPPARPRPWPGVRDATAPGNICPQRVDEGIVGAEDCLYLDVTVPRDTRPGERLPVLVWLYGGAFNTGAAQEYEGARLATTGDLIVVTPNYRLGALGFLSAPALDASGGNYGLMDQTAALRWARRNAARFGGDPHNVTLAGQSAGARAVCAHLASPQSRGLFQRAISASGACDNRVPTRAEAQAFGAQATEELGCATVQDGTAADIARCLRERPVADLVPVLRNVGFALNGRVADRPWNPVAGTPMLPWQPGEALRNGSAARVPLLIGGTRDEMRSFVLARATLTADEYRAMMVEAFGAGADAVLAEYPVSDFDTPALALAAVLSDWGGAIGACPVLRTAEAAAAHQPVYAYEFAQDSGQFPGGYPMGSYHGTDLPYLWELHLAQNPYPPLATEQQLRLSATMMGYWSAFAHTGDPNGGDRPQWPEFGTSGTVLGLAADRVAPAPFAADHRCGYWEGMPR